MRRRPIPTAAGKYTPEQQHEFNVAVKETLEGLAGQRGGRMDLLNDSASTAEIVAKINEICTLLQR